MNSQNSYKSVKKGEMDLCESEVVSYISMQGSQLLQDTVIVKEIAQDNYDFDPFQHNSPMKKSKEKKIAGLSFLKMRNS